MWIVYRTRNDCLCWLFLVTVDIFRDMLLQVIELPFCACIVLGHCSAPITVFSQPHGKNTIIRCPYYDFKYKRLFRMSLMHGNTDNISHVPILTWPGMTSSLTSHWSVNDFTQYFFRKYVSCVIIWYKNIPLETSMESFKGKPMLWKFSLYSN